LIAISVDAIAFEANGGYLPSAGSKNVFVIYAQPLDRSFTCFPIHVMPHSSGRATEPVQTAIDSACTALTDGPLIVKYICADGDSCHRKRHAEFFLDWYPVLINRGLQAALEHIRHQTRIPVGDFLHIWKSFCNKVKNHPVTLNPESTETLVDLPQLQRILRLGSALTDCSSVGKMRDSYALQLFSLLNCAELIEANELSAMLYLLPWALQEEVIRSPMLNREDRLTKAILSFKILRHLFDLSLLPCAPRIGKRFRQGEMLATTFAEDAAWPTLLNTSITLIQFVMEADPTWSFSRLGTHCLENFFGLIRRESLGDDRYVTAARIIAKNSLVAMTMQNLDLRISHRGRDNVGGVVIAGIRPDFVEAEAGLLCRSLMHLASLDAFSPEEHELLSLEQVTSVLIQWAVQDQHHDKDSAYRAKFDGKASNSRIAARIIHEAGPSLQTRDPKGPADAGEGAEQ
jgi:hypothetical protein